MILISKRSLNYLRTKRAAYLQSNMFIAYLLISVYTVYVESNAQKDYGTFNLTITRFDVCKGPKQKDCVSATATISNSSTIIYDLTVFENVSPTKGKIVATTANGNDILRLQVKKPCEHLFLRPLFTSLMNVTKECYILKGHYKFNANILAIAQSYFGGTFIFGNWTFKAVFYSDTCNFTCTNIQVMMSPLKKDH